MKMEKLSRMPTICVIFFAATAMSCVSNKPKTDTDPTWSLNMHFTTWTRNGTFTVTNFYEGFADPQFKNNRTILDSENNVTVVFETKINSFIEGKMDVQLTLENGPHTVTTDAAEIQFYRVRYNKEDGVLPVVSSRYAGDPFVRKVRGICYIQRCGQLPFWPQYQQEYNLFIQCDRVKPYPSVDVPSSNRTAEDHCSSLRDQVLASSNSLRDDIMEFNNRAMYRLNSLIPAQSHRED